MDNTYISLFNGVSDTTSSGSISVLDLLWKIGEGEWADKINAYRSEKDKTKKSNLKKQLPAVIFSGTFTGKNRLDTDVKGYTGIMVCDIDGINSQQLTYYKSILRRDNYVLAIFESPSKGLKVLIKVDSPLEFHKSHAFTQVEAYMKAHYKIEIDTSGKNLARLCFISYDKEMYYNDSSDNFPVDTEIDYEAIEERKRMVSLKRISDNMVQSNDSQFVFDTCVKIIKKSKVGGFYKGNRNKFVFVLSCRLSEAGVNPEMAAHYIMSRYPSLGSDEINTTVKSAYKRTSGEYGKKPIMVKPVKQQHKLF